MIKPFNQMLTNAKVMAYFDPIKETELITDALPFGLCVILIQKSPVQDDSRVVAYTSRALSDRSPAETMANASRSVWE